ncbi:MAG: hypothetical protein PHY16_05960 [Methylobacter sp.]|nr:hypothetical protein [Methylobacter sp.]
MNHICHRVNGLDGDEFLQYANLLKRTGDEGPEDFRFGFLVGGKPVPYQREMPLLMLLGLGETVRQDYHFLLVNF